MDITRMINAVKLRTNGMDNIPGFSGDSLSRGGPTLDELQRIHDLLRSQEKPTVSLKGSTIDHDDDDDDDVLQAALNKHFNK